MLRSCIPQSLHRSFDLILCIQNLRLKSFRSLFLLFQLFKTYTVLKLQKLPVSLRLCQGCFIILTLCLCQSRFCFLIIIRARFEFRLGVLRARKLDPFLISHLPGILIIDFYRASVILLAVGKIIPAYIPVGILVINRNIVLDPFCSISGLMHSVFNRPFGNIDIVHIISVVIGKIQLRRAYRKEYLVILILHIRGFKLRIDLIHQCLIGFGCLLGRVYRLTFCKEVHRCARFTSKCPGFRLRYRVLVHPYLTGFFRIVFNICIHTLIAVRAFRFVSYIPHIPVIAGKIPFN